MPLTDMTKSKLINKCRASKVIKLKHHQAKLHLRFRATIHSSIHQLLDFNLFTQKLDKDKKCIQFR